MTNNHLEMHYKLISNYKCMIKKGDFNAIPVK